MNWNSEEDFAEALFRFAEMIQWFTLPGGEDGSASIDKARMTLAEWDEKVAPHLGDLSPDLRAKIENNITPRLECLRAKHRLLFCSILHEVMEIRIPWVMADQLTVLPAKLGAIKTQGSPQVVGFVEMAARELLGCDLDPTTMFREIERRCEEGEAKWKKVRAELRCDWAEEFTPDLEARIMTTDVADFHAWRRELAAEIQAIQDRHPELR